MTTPTATSIFSTYLDLRNEYPGGDGIPCTPSGLLPRTYINSVPLVIDRDYYFFALLQVCDVDEHRTTWVSWLFGALRHTRMEVCWHDDRPVPFFEATDVYRYIRWAVSLAEGAEERWG